MTARGPRYFAKLAGKMRYIGRLCKNGHTERYVSDRACVICKAAEPRRFVPVNEKRRTYARLWARAHRNHNKEAAKMRICRERWTEEQRDAYRAAAKIRSRAWRKANPGHRNALAVKHKAARLKRTPLWADLAAIKDFYKNCPPGFHVDHVIPMRGLIVSGLHVLENLQYLPATENLRKNRRYADSLGAPQ